MGSLKVIDAGLYTTIQDAGRRGYRKYGIPYSGAMDGKAYDEANRLVGNPSGYPVIECTLQGGKFQFRSKAVIALTGADMTPELNGEPIKMNRSHQVYEGDELKLSYAKRGCRGYMAINGLLDANEVFGSFSTYERAGIGGFEGRALRAGDELSWSESDDEYTQRTTPVDEIPYFSSKLKVRVMKGPEWNWFSEVEKENFLKSDFKVSSNSDRMGIRLEGKGIQTPEQQMISSPVIPGIVQVPGNGHPIILLNDGQTIGGYPRIAKVLDSELWRLGQVKPGDKIRFSL